MTNAEAIRDCKEMISAGKQRSKITGDNSITVHADLGTFVSFLETCLTALMAQADDDLK